MTHRDGLPGFSAKSVRCGDAGHRKACATPSENLGKPLKRFGVPNGIRTRVPTLKEWSPRPLDDGDGGGLCGIRPVP